VAFTNTTFTGLAQFARASFRGEVDFGSARFLDDAKFRRARFDRWWQFDPAQLTGKLALDWAVCEERLRIETPCKSASFDHAEFRAGADILLSTDDVSFMDTDFAETSLVTGLGSSVPRITSLKGAKVAKLTVSGADLTPCLFIGAFGLDEMELGRVEFAQPPTGWNWGFRRQRWTRRQTLAEEHLWRQKAEHGWDAGGGAAPAAGDVAGAYRALRKGLEDRKNEPGAADFYYGEMEMRRRSTGESTLARAASAAERGLLWGYWAISGYALRASRVLLVLLIVIVVATAAFDMWGFQDRVRPYAARNQVHPEREAAKLADFPPSPGDVIGAWCSFEAWTYTAGTATAVIGAPEAQLTQYGRAIRIVLRILGPVLIGLAVLSIRGRVKR
jgi:hypothetical protein